MAEAKLNYKSFRLSPVSRGVIAACSAALITPQAFAQEQQLEEIIVTATKRSEAR